jgi:hypothetical protein
MPFTKEKTITVDAKYFAWGSDVAYSLEFLNDKGEACLAEVIYDHDSESPRTAWDNLWTWVTTSKAGYSDVKTQGNRKSGINTVYYKPEDFEDEEGKLDKEWLKTVLIERLYLYRHSGDSISVGKFGSADPRNCPWDSGCMGFAYVEKSKIREWFGVKKITKEVRERAYKNLTSEVKEMNMRNEGSVYGFRVINMVTEEDTHCWGFYCDSREEIAQRFSEEFEITLADAKKMVGIEEAQVA